MRNESAMNVKNYKRLSLIIITIEIIFLIAVSAGTYVYFTGMELEVLIIPMQLLGPLMFIFLVYGWFILNKNKISLLDIMLNKKLGLSKSIIAPGIYLIVAFPTNFVIFILFGTENIYWIIPLNLAIATPFILVSLFYAIRFYRKK